MALQDHLVWEAVPVYLTAVALAGLAVWLYVLAPRENAHRAFALDLFLGGFGALSVGLADTAADPFAQASFMGINRFVIAASLFPMVWFLLEYPRPRWTRRVRTRVLTGLGIVVVGGILVRLLGPGFSTVVFSPLGLWVSVPLALPGFVAFALSRDLRLPLDPHAHRSLRLVVLGFLLYPVYRAVRQVGHMWDGLQVVGADTVGRIGVMAETVLIMLGGVLALWAAWRLARDRDSGTGTAWTLFILLGACVALGISTVQGLTMRALTLGIVNMAIPVLVTYALLRHKLFGIDIKVRWTISKTTLAGIFVAAFFVASEAAQQFFGAAFGDAYVGIVAAGLLVFAIAPLSRFADRVAERAVPLAAIATVPVREYDLESDESAYVDAVRLALRDRSLTVTEDRALARLAERLGIPAARAVELREAAERDGDGGVRS